MVSPGHVGYPECLVIEGLVMLNKASMDCLTTLGSLHFCEGIKKMILIMFLVIVIVTRTI